MSYMYTSVKPTGAEDAACGDDRQQQRQPPSSLRGPRGRPCCRRHHGAQMRYRLRCDAAMARCRDVEMAPPSSARRSASSPDFWGDRLMNAWMERSDSIRPESPIRRSVGRSIHCTLKQAERCCQIRAAAGCACVSMSCASCIARRRRTLLCFTPVFQLPPTHHTRTCTSQASHLTGPVEPPCL